MRQRKKEQKEAEAARRAEIRRLKEEAERLAAEEEAALTAGLDDLEKVLMRSTIRAKVSEQGERYKETRGTSRGQKYPMYRQVVVAFLTASTHVQLMGWPEGIPT